MITRLIFVAIVILLVICASQTYAADASSDTGLKADQEKALQETLANPKTRLDQALLDFRKKMNEKAGK